MYRKICSFVHGRPIRVNRYAEKEAQSMHIKRLLEAEWSTSLPCVCPSAFVIKEITAQVPNLRF
ncbi:hypothetical protein Hanom_Chr14g01311951 [Helianthus anomalus]